MPNEDPRAITVDELLNDLDGNGLVLVDPDAIEKRLRLYFDLDFDTNLVYEGITS